MLPLNQQFKLSDGRRLGFDEYGVPDGRPVFYFHGTPSSRLEWSLFGSQELARTLRLRVIVPDRPGMGLSDFKSGRRISDWPADVAELADRLGIERFSVLGYSGGGPYALACALKIPGRLAGAGVVSGAGPFDQPGLTDGIHSASLGFFDLAKNKPWMGRQTLRMMGMMARYSGDKVIANTLEALPEPDRKTVTQPEIQTGFLKMLIEALRQGPRGGQHDTSLMVSPWEFRPQDIPIHVDLWHGEEDRNAPPAMGRYLAGLIPDCNIRLYPQEGHLSLIAGNLEGILQYLVG